MKKLINRVKAPTPKFFKKLRNVGLVLTAISTAIITAPVVLPGILVTAAGYLAVASGVVSAVSQITTSNEPK